MRKVSRKYDKQGALRESKPILIEIETCNQRNTAFSLSKWPMRFRSIGKSDVSGTLSVEAIYQDRVQFAQLVRDVATTDVCRMGIEILSFTIKVLLLPLILQCSANSKLYIKAR